MDLSAEEKTAAQPLGLEVPPPLASDLEEFRESLRVRGLRGGLWFLNARTPHRFTGVFRFDGEMLRNVALVDKWDPLVELGQDVPLASAYCAHLQREGGPLLVEDGSTDPRVPWMAKSEVVSYCGALIRDEAGEPWGALCHFDTSRCDAKTSDMPLIFAAAALIHKQASNRR